MKWKGKKIGVLMGGWSKEREISLRSGKAVYEALCRMGYNVISIDCQVVYRKCCRSKLLFYSFFK